jgi:hypothetical protein
LPTEQMVFARFDKHGRRFADTGHGCGCTLCAVSNAPRYERRHGPREAEGGWSPLRRLVRFARTLVLSRPHAAG